MLTAFHRRSAMTLIEMLVALGLMAIIFGGAFLSYSSILDTLTNSELRTAAVAVLNRETEIVRNLPYEDIGISGSFPTGILQHQKTVMWKNVDFLVITTVRNVDDPFDGTLGGTPNDTAPADYKMVELEVSCLRCQHFVPIALTTNVAPKNLESTGNSGSLFIHTIDPSGNAIPNIGVRVVNTSVNPTIDLTDTTNNSGVLQLVGVPTSTNAYKIYVSSTGYSTEQTYPIGAPANPNPIHPYMTVQSGRLSDVTFIIDELAQATIFTQGPACTPVQHVPVSLTGSHFIGTSPNVVKFATSTQTDDRGFVTLSNIEWDGGYSVSWTLPGYDLIAPMPFLPFVVTGGTSTQLRLIFAPHTSTALSVHARQGGGMNPIPGAYITISQGGFSRTLVAGHAELEQTDWFGNQYFAQSGKIDVASYPGSMTLTGPVYPTSSIEWLISNTFDAGSASTTAYSFAWNGSAPAGTAVSFQLASNNDQTTWNFVGPDGTASTYFTATTSTPIPFALSGKQYFRYKVYLSTVEAGVTPQVDWASIEYSGMCVPTASVYFNGLSAGTYDLRATALGFDEATTTVTVASGWQEQTVLMNQL
jgi:prepilin-type N-terminal cleavage/methylation domain-containing protein